MSDPAEKAANRVALEITNGIYYHHLLDSAREVLKPIQELHAKWSDWHGLYLNPHVMTLLDELAQLIYTTEELGSTPVRNTALYRFLANEGLKQ